MLQRKTIFLLLFVYLALSECRTSKNNKQTVRKFPEGFMFGTATASYQIEGAWDADGKSENIWDHLTHNNPNAIADGSNGDIAGDSYHLYKRDVEMVRELGLDYYRFSLSWTRILPTSFPNYINKAGVQYYSNLIDELLKYKIEPMITLYHWDLPQKLQDMGGWANPEIVNWYADYVRVVFDLYGDRVKYWITMNEPRQTCLQGYGGDVKAPRVNITGIAEYLCAKNLLMAHATAYHIYDQEYRPKYHGKIFITLSAQHLEPSSEADIEAADYASQFDWGQYAHPIFSESGDFPSVMKKRIAAKSAEQGFRRSRLPEFTPEEVELLKGSSDYFGLNHYTTNLVYRNESVKNCNYSVPSFSDDLGVKEYQSSDWGTSASGFLKVVPSGFYKLLTKIRKEYNNTPVFVTENGYSTYGGLDDDKRIAYVRQYMSAMLDAMDDGSDVRAYTYWSHMDNFEWGQGFTERFGLYEVNYTSPERTRTPRKSAFVYKQIVRTRELDFDYEPDTTVMTIDKGH